MTERTISEQLSKYLTDVHSIEVQALAQLERAPGIAGEPRLAEAFREHLGETREHERLVREALHARGADTTALKDAAGRVGGWAMVLFARLNPDTPGKLTAHAFAYEQMEVAAYELLARAAQRAEDQPVLELAHRIRDQERTMADRLAQCFDQAVEASLAEKDADAIASQLVSYLRNARAIEAQALQLLRLGPTIAGSSPLPDLFREHRKETREHQRLVQQRLKAHDASPSRIQDTLLSIGGVSMGAFFAVQPDTPAKIAGFAFAFENLEIASYELLRRVAQRANDPETVATAEQILTQERTAAARLATTWDAAMDAALTKLGAASA
jgi:ferritin-like metal-binding protein YciE